MMELILTVTAGLVLFLFGVFQLSEAIRHSYTDRARSWLKSSTKSYIRAILVGCLVTILLDSSSAVIIITIVLVNGRLIDLRGAMGIVMGANVGTTFSSQLFALDVARYAPLLMAVGFLLMLTLKQANQQNIAQMIFYFGMLFFGMQVMGWGVEPLKHHAQFEAYMQQIENPLQGALTGALATLIIQSSSATVGMAIVLAKKGLISLKAGIAVMLGAELGTCSDTLLATIRSQRPALKTGLFHLLFNLISIIVGLFLFNPFVHLVSYISGSAHLDQQLANAHMLFNILGVIILGSFVGVFEKLLNHLLPDEVATNAPLKKATLEEV